MLVFLCRVLLLHSVPATKWGSLVVGFVIYQRWHSLVTHSTSTPFTNPSSFLLSPWEFDRRKFHTDKAFQNWSAAADQIKHSRMELSSVTGCTCCSASFHSSSVRKGRSESSRFKSIWAFTPWRCAFNKEPRVTSKGGKELLSISPLCAWEWQETYFFVNKP